MLRSDPRIHYKMYKAKKNMVYAALFSFAVLGGLSLNQNAKADTVENNNVTPAVQIMTAQSTASDANTVNSAPTTQPVSAQPVINSQANSASNTGNQIQTTALNVQPVQPARNLAVTRRARLYMQNLAQAQSNQAQNVQVDTHDWAPNSGTTRHAQPDSSYPFGQTVNWQTDITFDVTADQLRAGQPINIGQFYVTQTPVNSYEDTFKWNNLNGTVKVRNANGIDLGQVVWSDDQGKSTHTLQLLPNKEFQGTGVQHAIISGLQSEVGYMPSTQAYRGHGAMATQLTWHLDNQVFNTTITAPHLSPIIDSSNSPLWQSAPDRRPGTTRVAKNGIVEDRISDYLTNDQASAYSASHGKSLGSNATVNRGATEFTYRLSSSNNTIMPVDHFHIEKWGVFVDSQGNVHNENYYINDYNHDNLNCVNAGDGRTIAQMKALPATDENGSKVYYSRQSNGDLLYYVYATPQDLKANSEQVRSQAEQATTTNLDPDPEKAVENTVNYYQNGPLQSFPTAVDFVLYNDRADNQINTHVTTTWYDPNTGAIINKPLNADWGFVSSMAHGQAAVKLHVINAQNGTELNQ